MSGFSTIRLKATDTPNYATRELPKIKSAALKGTVLNVETDIPTKQQYLLPIPMQNCIQRVWSVEVTLLTQLIRLI